MPKSLHLDLEPTDPVAHPHYPARKPNAAKPFYAIVPEPASPSKDDSEQTSPPASNAHTAHPEPGR